MSEDQMVNADDAIRRLVMALTDLRRLVSTSEGRAYVEANWEVIGSAALDLRYVAYMARDHDGVSA